MMLSRRLLARVLLPFAIIFFGWMPSKSYAFLPLVLTTARIASVALRTPAGQQVLNATTGIALAMIINSVIVNRIDANGNTRTDEIRLNDLPLDPTPTEAAAGFTRPSLPGERPVPPSTVAPSSASSARGSYTLGDPAACAARGWVSIYGVQATCVVPVSPSICVVAINYGDVMFIDTACFNTLPVSITCPAGYSSSGSTCSLSRPMEVVRPSDGVCPILRVGSSYSVDSLDADCLNGLDQNPTLSPSAAGGGHVVVPAFNGDSVDVTTYPDGTQHISYTNTDPVTGVPHHTDIGVSAPPISSVTGVTSGTGVVSGTPAAPAAPVTFPPFPTDYARAGEVSTAADRVIAAMSAPVSTADPALPLPADMPWIDPAVTGGLTNWVMPTHTSVCPAPTLDLSPVLGAGHSYVFNAHCGLMDATFGKFRPVMILVFVIAAIFIVLRA